VSLAGGLYAVQQQWRNRVSGCVDNLTEPNTVDSTPIYQSYLTVKPACHDVAAGCTVSEISKLLLLH
jgi:hypothetical protein